MTTTTRQSRKRALTASAVGLIMLPLQHASSFEQSPLRPTIRSIFVRSSSNSRTPVASRTLSLLCASLEPGQKEITSSSSLNPSFHNNVQRTTTMQELLQLALQLWTLALAVSILLISWEDVSMAHPMRYETTAAVSTTTTSSWGQSTVRGMAFGEPQRLAIHHSQQDASLLLLLLEPPEYQGLASYNEVMLRHRNERVVQWNHHQQHIIQEDNVRDAVKNIQLAVLKLQDCKQLAKDYDWDKLEAILLKDRSNTFRSLLDSSCYLLQQADQFLSPDAREVVGFDWGSCAWRHCGALADAQEALDVIEHLLGVLEPFECLFCLDIIERSLRDILDVTTSYHNAELQQQIPAYVSLQRMSDVNEDNLDGFDTDFLDTLSVLKNTEI